MKMWLGRYADQSFLIDHNISYRQCHALMHKWRILCKFTSSRVLDSALMGSCPPLPKAIDVTSNRSNLFGWQEIRGTSPVLINYQILWSWTHNMTPHGSHFFMTTCLTNLLRIHIASWVHNLTTSNTIPIPTIYQKSTWPQKQTGISIISWSFDLISTIVMAHTLNTQVSDLQKHVDFITTVYLHPSHTRKNNNNKRETWRSLI